MDQQIEIGTIGYPVRRKHMAAALTANSTVAEKQGTPQAGEGPQRFMTAFGNLTVQEIRDWEKMLGKRLFKS